MTNENGGRFEAGDEAYQARNYVRALAVWRPLAEGGDARAQVGVAVCLLYGGVGVGTLVRTDYGQAIQWLKKAVAQGNAEGEFHLAQCYEQGRGVPTNLAQAIELYRRSAEHGLAFSQFTLALKHINGQGLPQDEVLAAAWLRRAAGQGLKYAQLRLAECYIQGRGVRKDSVMAYVNYHIGGRKAIDPREPPTALELLAFELSAEQRAEADSLVQSWTPGGLAAASVKDRVVTRALR